MLSTVLLAVLLAASVCYYMLIQPLFTGPLSKIPGPPLYALTKWRLALDDWNANRSRTLEKLHRRYGPVVRVGPAEVHFNSLAALRTIYGAGSGYERTAFYRMFDVYGKQNLFTFRSSRQHADRKKLLANAYSKSSIMRPDNARMIEDKVRQYLEHIEGLDGEPDEVFTSLHYFSLDAITHFIYGPEFGATRALAGDVSSRALLGDILHPSRRRLSWCVVHIRALTLWMYTRAGLVGRLIRPFLPMPKPATYTGIRDHALKACQGFLAAAAEDNNGDLAKQTSVISLLYRHHVSQKDGSLDDLDIASECADHLLAGIDTTADTLMFLFWALSLPENHHHQTALAAELDALPAPESLDPSGGGGGGILPVSTATAVDQLPYLTAVIKETLRLHAPLPATEPRVLSHSAVVVDTHLIPAGVVVGMSPYTLHRNLAAFPAPHVFDPTRWLSPDRAGPEVHRWFWAFSSGARMCIGQHLALAEMAALVAGVYRRYSTEIAPEFEGCSPGITARFEVFYAEGMSRVKEHECWIRFRRREG